MDESTALKKRLQRSSPRRVSLSLGKDLGGKAKSQGLNSTFRATLLRNLGISSMEKEGRIKASRTLLHET